MKKTKSEIYDCLIVGAGPAGLSISYYLKKKQLNFAILEKGSVGYSWKKMPSFFKLITPMWTNSLPGDTLRVNPFKLISCNEYGEYLDAYSQRNSLNIKLGHEVITVNRNDEGLYEVDTNRGCFISKVVVCASGYFANPNIPEQISLNENNVIHTADFNDVFQEKTDEIEKVLVVGKRNSAGQLVVELNRLGVDVALSTRGAIEYRFNEGIFRRIRESLYFFWEYFQIKLSPKQKKNSYPPMDSKFAKKLIDSGEVPCKPNVKNVSGNWVSFVDESSEQYDLVILATGFNPATQYYEPNIQVNQILLNKDKWEEQNTYFIGIDNLYNFRSRYLRGMTKDAATLASKISRKIRGNI